MMSSVSTKRIEYIDIAKGIGIILVVMGHTIGTEVLVGSWIFSFHMPLFFFLSGLCFNDERHPLFLPFLKKRIQTLFLPLVYFSVICLVVSVLTGASNYSIEKIQNGEFTGALWFLYVLFLSELFYWIINRLSQHTAIKFAVIIVCLFIGISLQKLDFTLPFNHCSVFPATFFYGLGHLSRSKMALLVARIPAWGGGFC